MYSKLKTAQKVLNGCGYDTKLYHNYRKQQMLHINHCNNYSLTHSNKHGYRLYFTGKWFIKIDDYNQLLQIMREGV